MLTATEKPATVLVWLTVVDRLSWTYRDRPNFKVHMSSLKELTITFEAAEILFAGINLPTPALLPEAVCFPSPTHLTLLDVEHRGCIAFDCPDISRLLPWIPYHHMPNLSHFHIPKSPRGENNYQSMALSAVQALIVYTQIEHFIAPGLVSISPDVNDADAPAPLAADEPVVAHKLKHMHVAPRELPEFMQFVAIPKGGVWSVHG
ncbi:hypothetical protein BCR44DRAFT_1431974 [Catenaria anguillulae PL171]|uniref:Uncharacterized protein n=1 Tax=Catenaria anguillulae PL171 TaxID=765915 RepID=A0A1Y2HSZ3_9FUNG|nr:hypothetical protein BCR44DRAFT_1431974 [Catenaria anguillulae PL171]